MKLILKKKAHESKLIKQIKQSYSCWSWVGAQKPTHSDLSSSLIVAPRKAGKAKDSEEHRPSFMTVWNLKDKMEEAWARKRCQLYPTLCTLLGFSHIWMNDWANLMKTNSLRDMKDNSFFTREEGMGPRY